MKIKLIASIIGVLLTTQAFSADKNQSQKVETQAIETTKVQSEHAHKRWNVTPKEYARYQELMKGVRGSISPANISPIEVLGIHARTDAERMKYARIWANIMDKDTKQVLAFNKAYSQAWVEKGSPDMVDMSKLDLGVSTKKTESVTGRELIFVTKLEDGCKPCNAKLESMLQSLVIDKSLGVDIYFADSTGKSKSVIRQWASTHNIDTKLLKSGRLTLNHGADVVAKLKLSPTNLPATFEKKSNGSVKRLD